MQISRIPQHVSFLCWPTWRQTLLIFELLPDNIYQDFINEFQYRVAKMQTKLEIRIKYGNAIFFRDIWVNKQLINKNSTIHEPKIVYFQEAFTDLYKKCWFLTKTLCMPCKLGSSGHRDLFGTKKSLLFNISPELWFLYSAEKTWYPWFCTESVMWREKGNTMKYSWSPREIPRAKP